MKHCTIYIASFPGSPVLQATKAGWRPGNEATIYFRHNDCGGSPHLQQHLGDLFTALAWVGGAGLVEVYHSPLAPLLFPLPGCHGNVHRLLEGNPPYRCSQIAIFVSLIAAVDLPLVRSAAEPEAGRRRWRDAGGCGCGSGGGGGGGEAAGGWVELQTCSSL